MNRNKEKERLIKDKLISEIINDINNDPINYEDYKNDLLKEALLRRTIAELKNILNGW